MEASAEGRQLGFNRSISQAYKAVDGSAVPHRRLKAARLREDAGQEQMRPLDRDGGLTSQRSGFHVFKTTHTEGLATARRLLRGYAGAPDPRRQIQQMYGALVHAEGWSKAHEQLILSFGAWLQNHPALGELKLEAGALLAKLA